MQFHRKPPLSSSSHQQGELIVDFPTVARSKVSQKQKGAAKHSCVSQPHQHQAQPKKSVHFSEECTVQDVSNPSDEEISCSWYTEQDYRGFQRKMWRDVRRQSALYVATKTRDPNAMLPVEEVIKCVGLVHLLSDDVEARYQEYKLNRRMHSNAILDEHDRQLEESGYVHDISLAKLSMTRSKADKVKAIKAAILSGSAKPYHRRESC